VTPIGVLLSALLTGVLMASADAGAGLGFRDKHGDVRVRGAGSGLTAAQLRSIDLHKVTVVPGAGGASVKFSFAQVVKQHGWNQAFFLNIEPPAGSAETWVSGVTMLNNGNGRAIIASDPSFTTVVVCRLHVHVNKRKATISAQVPDRCLPTGEVRLGAGSLTGVYRSNTKPYSTDKLKIRGSYVLHG
jgi:hypothetical protein